MFTIREHFLKKNTIMIDLTRSLGVFDPAKLEHDIHIYGAGASGSHVCESLILHGVSGSRINVYDFDVIEEHNIANQVYTNEHIGMLKVEALQNLISERYGETIKAHNVKVLNAGENRGIHLLLIDGNRGPLFSTLKFKGDVVKMLIETGLDARAGRCIIMSPNSLSHNRYFEKKYLEMEGDGSDPDAGAERSACGSRQVISATVKVLAAMVTWELIRWVNDNSYIGKDTFFSLDPFYIEVTDI